MRNMYTQDRCYTKTRDSGDVDEKKRGDSGDVDMEKYGDS